MAVPIVIRYINTQKQLNLDLAGGAYSLNRPHRFNHCLKTLS